MAKAAMKDMVIVVPGITGSVLVDEHDDDIWNVSGQAVWSYIRTLGTSLERLIVPTHPPGTDAPTGGVRAQSLVQGIHGVFGLGRIDGYRALSSMILDNFDVTAATEDESVPANYFEFAYDWRLSNRTTAAKLKALVETRLPIWQRSQKGGRDAKIILVAHSMGGLVSRYYLEKLEGWENCRALVTFGTPYRGSVNAIDYLANGYKKAFVDFTDAMRSMPSVYELLPIWRMLGDRGAWRRPAEAEGVPNLSSARAGDALAFHREIEEAVERHKAIPEYLANRYHIIPVVGVAQPTLQSARIDGNSLSTSRELPGWIDTTLGGGDGTVPRVSATPIELSDEYRETFFAERHGSLQNNLYVLDDLRERLKQMQSTGLKEIRGSWSGTEERAQLSLDVDPLYLPGEPVRLQARLLGQPTSTVGLKARLQPVNGTDPASEHEFREVGDGFELTLEGLAPGAYRVKIRGTTGGPAGATPVSEVFEVAGKE
jgi:pimeloyl-ACP methyl ester carboxylesterase